MTQPEASRLETYISRKGLPNPREAASNFSTAATYPGLTAQFLEKMLDAVIADAGEGRERPEEFLKTMANYRGVIGILQKFLTAMGTNNPYEAYRRAQIWMPRRDEISKELLIDIENEEDLPLVRGADGKMIKHVYQAYDSENRGSGVYHSGRIAISTIANAFGSGLSYESEISKDNRHKDILEELVAEYLLSRGDSEKTSSSKPRTKISELQDAEKKLREELDGIIATLSSEAADLLFGDSLIVLAHGLEDIRGDVGGQFFGWFNRRKNLPEWVENTLASLKDPFTKISAEDEADFLRALLRYQQNHSLIEKRYALTPFQDALMHYKEKHGDQALPAGLLRLGEFMQSEREYLTLEELASVLSDGVLESFWLSENKEEFEKFKAELSHIANLRSHLFYDEDGRLRRHSKKESMPMGILGKSWLGSTDIDPIGAPQACLNRDDFAALRKLMDLQYFSSSEDKSFLTMPISSFKELLRNALIAGRKADYLEAQLGMANAEFLEPDSDGVVKVVMPESLPPEADLCPLPHASYITAENFEDKYGVSLIEIANRIDKISKPKEFIVQRGENSGDLNETAKLFFRSSETGLVVDGDFYEKFISKLMEYCHRDELSVELQEIQEALKDPRVRYHDFSFIDLDGEYFSGNDVEEIKKAAPLNRWLKDNPDTPVKIDYDIYGDIFEERRPKVTRIRFSSNWLKILPSGEAALAKGKKHTDFPLTASYSNYEYKSYLKWICENIAISSQGGYRPDKELENVLNALFEKNEEDFKAWLLSEFGREEDL